jgi:Zn-dependent protease with chaperone function
MGFRGVAFSLALAALAVLGGCATNTMTGRSQLSLVSEASVSQQSVSSYTAMMGDLDKKKKIIEGTALNDRVNTISNKLIQQAVLYHPKSSQWDWKVSVIDDDKTVNAFCMPGGLMAIYTGIIYQLDATDDEIANVMGHEIGHALAGHGAEKMSMQMASNTAVAILSILVSKDNKERQDTNNALTAGALAFINLPNGRTTEIEADKIGIELAARAGYNPEAAVTLWEKMGRVTKSKGKGDFLSTHPAPERRQENLRRLGEFMQPFYVVGKSAPAPYDWLNGDKFGRPTYSERDAIAFYSEEWEAFKAGTVSLNGTNQLSMVMKQGDFAKSYKEQRWRDLAMGVSGNNYMWDLGYFYLAKAAAALGYPDAAKAYFSKAEELAASEDTACAKRRLLSCSGIDVASELQGENR